MLNETLNTIVQDAEREVHSQETNFTIPYPRNKFILNKEVL